MPESVVRVSVASGSRRMDLVLPGSVPVAELVPELARSVGLLDAHTVQGGYRLVTRDGRQLAGDAGLTAQGVDDGGLLTVSVGIDEPPPRVYDDVVEAMADAVERHLAPWGLASGRVTVWGAGVLLMALAAAALLVLSGPFAAVAALGVVLILLAVAVGLSRVRGERGAAVALAWLGSAYAAAVGFMLVPTGAGAAGILVGTGAAVLAAGLVSLVGLDGGRALALLPVLAGSVLLATAMLLHARPRDPALVLAVVLTLVVLLGDVLPRLALGAAGTALRPLTSTQFTVSDAMAVDADRVEADARLADEILLALSTTAGLVLVLVAPFAVSLGRVGTLLALTCCLLVMLRTRRYRSGAQVLVGRVSGLLGVASGAVATLWLHPGWRPATAVGLVAAGAAVLAVALLPLPPSVRRSRWGDLLESTALLSLLPLLVLATGVLPMLRT